MLFRCFYALLIGFVVSSLACADDWPQWRGPNRDGVWKETGLVEKFADKELPANWRVPIGAGYSGPTVADGRVYVMDRQTKPRQTERILCVDGESGKSLWKHEYDCVYKISYEAGPRASVTIDEGRAYAIGSMGHLHCLDAKTGDVVWSKDCNRQYDVEMPIWGITASPLIYKDLVIVHIGGSDGACVVAFDKQSGEEKWKALDDRGQYSSPVLVRQGDTDVAIVWTGDSVAGLDAATGKVHWRHVWKPRNMPIGVASPVVDKPRVFLTSFYDGSTLLELSPDKPQSKVLWQRVGRSERNTEALQSIISTPIILGDYVYGVDSYGELRCLDLAQGDRVWEDLTAVPKARWSTIHFVKNNDRIWMFNERGELIIAKLSPAGFEEISRTQVISPTRAQLNQRGGVVWTHPAFANRSIYVRNDEELVCASLAE